MNKRMHLEDLAALSQFAEQCVDAWTPGSIIALSGDLGAGKTSFVRAVIEQICKKSGAKMPRVASPTYVLHQSYSELKTPVEHFDWYRAENLTTDELIDMGFFEAIERAVEGDGYVFVEWPEKLIEDSVQFTDHLLFEVEESGKHFVTRQA